MRYFVKLLKLHAAYCAASEAVILDTLQDGTRQDDGQTESPSRVILRKLRRLLKKMS